MQWEKRGLVYAPSGNRWWARSHALLPTPDVLDDARIRVYFAALDDERYGRIGFVEVDSEDPSRVLFETEEPVLNLGEPGAFDDAGVTPSCVLDIDGELWLYYIGWQRTVRTPYQLFAGLAVSRDGGRTFRRHSRAPVLDRTDAEPFSRAAPFIRAAVGGYRMWYWSCFRWSLDGDRTHYNNELRSAESSDGIRWRAAPELCLVPENPEYSIGRPWVLRDRDCYRMWYSIRSRSAPYRLGYAESDDGIHWTRKDAEVGIHASKFGWDSEMICYSSVVDAAGHRYMFYNGNGHGATGFGYAVAKD